MGDEVAAAAEAGFIGGEDFHVLAGSHAEAELGFRAGFMEVEGEKQPAAGKGEKAPVLMDEAEFRIFGKVAAVPVHNVPEKRSVPAGQGGVEGQLVFRKLPLTVGVLLIVQPFGVINTFLEAS